MTTTDTTRPPLAGVARVIPWDDMTDRQQRQHLRVMHGRDPDRPAEWPLDWNALAHAISHEPWSISRPIPIPHTHDKETP